MGKITEIDLSVRIDRESMYGEKFASHHQNRKPGKYSSCTFWYKDVIAVN
jgi:hypothetical protein